VPYIKEQEKCQYNKQLIVVAVPALCLTVNRSAPSATTKHLSIFVHNVATKPTLTDIVTFATLTLLNLCAL
jgi:hypothetical protein